MARGKVKAGEILLTFTLKKVTRSLYFRVVVSEDGKSSERELHF